MASNALGHDVGVEIRLLHFEDVDLNILARDLLELELELLNILTTLSDDHTGTAGADRDRHEFGSALDYDARDIFVYASVFLLAGRGATGLFDVAFETCIEIFANLAIFEDVFAEVRTTEPVGVPTADDAKSVGDRIDFLTHCYCF